MDVWKKTRSIGKWALGIAAEEALVGILGVQKMVTDALPQIAPFLKPIGIILALATIAAFAEDRVRKFFRGANSKAVRSRPAPPAVRRPMTPSPVVEEPLPAASASPATPAPVYQMAPDKEWCPYSPAQLIAMVKGKTATQTRVIIQPYVGKWVECEGEIIQVMDLTGGGQSVMIETQDGTTVSLWFDTMTAEHEGMFLAISQGDSFSAGGELFEVSTRFVTLNKCEFR